MGNLSVYPPRLDLSPKGHIANDQGFYFTATNGQTAVAPNYGTAFSATAPFIVVYNGATYKVGAQVLYLDYVSLLTAAAGACTTTTGYTAIAVVMDNGNRLSSGGTTLTLNCANQNTVKSATNVVVTAGAITATAASSAARTIVGARNIRPGVSTTNYSAVGDQNILVFGSNEQAQSATVTLANPQSLTMPLPSIIIGPQMSALVYIWFPVMTAPSAGTFVPEVGFWFV
jgi:hypothetical protein